MLLSLKLLDEWGALSTAGLHRAWPKMAFLCLISQKVLYMECLMDIGQVHYNAAVTCMSVMHWKRPKYRMLGAMLPCHHVKFACLALNATDDCAVAVHT